MNYVAPGLESEPAIQPGNFAVGFLRKVLRTGLMVALAAQFPATAQTIKSTDDGTVLKAIFFFGRHSIRATTTASNTLNQCAADPFPGFSAAPGILTTNGQHCAWLLGSYFRDYLVHEGRLTDDADSNLTRCYFRANTIQRSYETCAQFGAGLVPNANIPVHTFPANVPDPVIDPLLAGVTTIDTNLALVSVQGIYGNGDNLASAYSGELSLLSRVLYPAGTEPIYPPGILAPTNAPPGAMDPTTLPMTLAASVPLQLTTNVSRYLSGGVIDMGGFDTVVNTADPFVMQYCDGFPTNEVGWGRLTMATLSQATRIAILQIAVEMRSPYLNRVQSSNLGHHLLRSLQQAASGATVDGAFGDTNSQVVVVTSSDYYVAGLAGLLNLHWCLPGYQPDFCAPGGVLVFELRQVKATSQNIVRTYYTAQTFDQLRNLTPLTLAEPPATLQLAVPGGNNSFTNLDVDVNTFAELLTRAIDTNCVQSPSHEILPGVMNPYTATNEISLVASTSGKTLALAWPLDHQGWVLQAQTNGLAPDRWFDVPGTAQVISTTITADPDNQAVFYRLRSP